MQYSRLTDDALWRAITKNTNAVSALFEATDATFSIQRRIDDLQREYQNYAAELRRRYPLVLNSETPPSAGSDQAA